MKTRHCYLPFVQALLLGATLSACAEDTPEAPTETAKGATQEEAAQGNQAEQADQDRAKHPAGSSDGDAADRPRDGANDRDQGQASAAGAAGAAGSAAGAAGAAGAGAPFSSGPIVPPELPASFA